MILHYRLRILNCLGLHQLSLQYLLYLTIKNVEFCVSTVPCFPQSGKRGPKPLDKDGIFERSDHHRCHHCYPYPSSLPYQKRDTRFYRQTAMLLYFRGAAASLHIGSSTAALAGDEKIRDTLIANHYR